MRRLLLAGACALAAAWVAPSAEASFSACTYDAGSHTATASMAEPGAARLSVGPGGEIMADDTPCGAATTSNTDDVVAAGSSDTDEITIDLSGPGGPFAKPGTDDEVHFTVYLGSDRCYGECVFDRQFVRVMGTDGADYIAAGEDPRSDSAARVKVNFDAGEDTDADLALVDSDAFGLRIEAGEGDDTITGRGGSGTGIAPTPVRMSGGPGDDWLAAGGLYNSILPGTGDDHVLGPGSRGAISYEDLPTGVVVNGDHETVAEIGGGGQDVYEDVGFVSGSEHHDVMKGGYSPGVSYSGGGGDDTLIGTVDSDSLYGGDGNDTIRGRAEGDLIAGGAGNDLLDGGPGNDEYRFDRPGAPELDTIVEGLDGDSDTLDLSWYGRAPATVDLSTRTASIFATRGRWRLKAAQRGYARNIENVWTSNAADRVIGNWRDNLISGGGVDTIDCRGGHDTAVVFRGARTKNCEVRQ